MLRTHVQILRNLRELIAQDLDVKNGVLMHLQAEYILENEQCTRILQNSTKRAQAEHLLDLLETCGPQAFNSFRQSLRHHYDWMSDAMDDRLRAHEKRIITDGKKSINLPKISPLIIARDTKIDKLKGDLKKLPLGHYLVLHGMKGYGKGSLANITLQDEAVAENFDNKIFWVKFGDHLQDLDQKIKIELSNLYQQVTNSRDSPVLDASTSLKDAYIVHLQNLFREAENSSALLVLQDACDRSILEAFDFDCRKMVITKDIGIFDQVPNYKTVFELNEGLTPSESLKLFAKVLETDVNKLPPEAKDLHRACKGMPLLISMFAAHMEGFKEDMSNRSRWKSYINSLQTKDRSFPVINGIYNEYTPIFDMFISQLDDGIKQHYKELAIFNEDVNIMPKTLELLWGLEAFHVEEILLKLCHKSLAVKQWNEGLKCYVYGIHDLLLSHLRSGFDKSQLQAMHKNFVEKYIGYCNNDFSRLPNDNYSYSYIGHHLERADMIDRFDVFLDLKFIESKISKAGISDLLIDLEKYKNYITKDDRSLIKWKSLSNFLREQAALIAEHRRKNCLSIVQIAMNYNVDGYVRQEALRLARLETDLLFLHNDNSIDYETDTCEEVPAEISVISYTNIADHTLIGTNSGEIYVWDENNKNIIEQYHSLSSKIKKILVANDSEFFLVLSEDGIVKLFELSSSLNNTGTSPVSTIQVQSPRCKQNYYSDFWSSPENSSTLNFDEKIEDITLSSDDQHVAYCTKYGKIKVCVLKKNVHGQYTPTNSTYVDSTETGVLKLLTFTSKAALLHVVPTTGDIRLKSYRVDQGGEYNYASNYAPSFKCKNIILFEQIPNSEKIIVVTEKIALWITWTFFKGSSLSNYGKKVRAQCEHENYIFTCATVTYDGQYLVVADSSGVINIWGVETGLNVQTYDAFVTSLSTYYLFEDNCHLISGSYGKLIHRFVFDANKHTDDSRRISVFDACMGSYEKQSKVAKEAVTEDNKVKVIMSQDNKVIGMTDYADDKLLSLHVNNSEMKILYATERGSVYLYDVETKQTNVIMKLANATNFVKFSTVADEEVVVCLEDFQLRVWINDKLTGFIPETGEVIALYELSKDRIVTLTAYGGIKYWNTPSVLSWECIGDVAAGNSKINGNALSGKRNYLALVKEDNEITVCGIFDSCVQSLDTRKLSNKPTSCDFSPDEKYLAIGFDNGDILITQLETKNEANSSILKELHTLSFHTNTVDQLYWAPVLEDNPILLAVVNNELTWWNVKSLIKGKSSRNRRNRKGVISNGNRFSGNFTAQQTPNNEVGGSTKPTTLTLVNSNQDQMINFWKSRSPRYDGIQGLLGIARLHRATAAKVCVSEDFTKFLTIDPLGNINSLRVFNYNN